MYNQIFFLHKIIVDINQNYLLEWARDRILVKRAGNWKANYFNHNQISKLNAIFDYILLLRCFQFVNSLAIVDWKLKLSE